MLVYGNYSRRTLNFRLLWLNISQHWSLSWPSTENRSVHHDINVLSGKYNANQRSLEQSKLKICQTNIGLNFIGKGECFLIWWILCDFVSIIRQNDSWICLFVLFLGYSVCTISAPFWISFYRSYMH